MTIEEVAELARLVSQQIENCAPWNITDDRGNTTIITKREIIGLTIGLNSVNAFATMEPSKPLAEFTVGELLETAKSIIASYANALSLFGLFGPQEPAPEGEGDGSGTEA